MKNLLLIVALVPLARSQSHVQVTIGGSSYEHGNPIELPHPPTPLAPAPAAPYKPRPTPATYHPTPSPYHPTPVHYQPRPTPYAPVQAVHVPHLPAVHVQKLPVAHAPQYHVPAYGSYKASHEPRYNCTVEDNVVKGEVCIPTLIPSCTQEKLMVQRIVDKQQCQDITRTVCTESMETVPNTVCTYMYESQQMMASATTFEVSFEKMCTEQMVTVCQPGGYGYQSYGQHDCKEVSQETCYNAPMLKPMEEMVSIAYPVPMMDCAERPVSLPLVTCQDITENQCITLPQLMEDVVMVEKCVVELGTPSCQEVTLTLPNQVCRQIVYGDVHH